MMNTSAESAALVAAVVGLAGWALLTFRKWVEDNKRRLDKLQERYDEMLEKQAANFAVVIAENSQASRTNAEASGRLMAMVQVLIDLFRTRPCMMDSTDIEKLRAK